MEPPVAGRRTGWVVVLQGVQFLGELALVAGAGWLGALLGNGGWRSAVLAVVGVTAVVVLWAVLMAPRSSRRLPDPARLLVELVLYLGTGISLAQLGHPKVSIIPMGVAVLAAALDRAFVPRR
jgi:hypothetical protein